jgi:sugar (pentulose or hexulose) kinase
MKTDIILVFDIGKTNKKVILFNKELIIISEEENQFDEITDDDGFPCDDIDRIEEWILKTCETILMDENFRIIGINFTTYGATLMHTDESGLRMTPVYNYLKPMPEGIVEPLYNKYGGKDEFCKTTASPPLGMLNSGLQILWLKYSKERVFQEVRNILHFPQYLSSLLTGETCSEHTSIGCHTALWDFDNMKYHDWIGEEGIQLPDPISAETTYPAKKIQSKVPVGIGIHDSSASLVPYLKKSNKQFILVSTGTWCITMNPYNYSPLTREELSRDCLTFMSIQEKPVKSSRFFLGHIHDVNVQKICDYFKLPGDAYKAVLPDKSLLQSCINEGVGRQVFFSAGMPADYIDRDVDLARFASFEAAYHQFMFDLTNLAADSINLVIEENDATEDIYITGGFAHNPIFVILIATCFADRKVYTSEMANSTSLGAALAIWDTLGLDQEPPIDLGIKCIEALEGK